MAVTHFQLVHGPAVARETRGHQPVWWDGNQMIRVLFSSRVCSERPSSLSYGLNMSTGQENVKSVCLTAGTLKGKNQGGDAFMRRGRAETEPLFGLTKPNIPHHFLLLPEKKKGSSR